MSQVDDANSFDALAPTNTNERSRVSAYYTAEMFVVQDEYAPDGWISTESPAEIRQ